VRSSFLGYVKRSIRVPSAESMVPARLSRPVKSLLF
jgi:hypothetical protein